MIDAFGWFVAVLGCSISLPQLLRLVRSRTVAGVALTTWQVTLGANLAWASHGFVVDRVTIWLPNLILAVWTLLILQMFHRHTATSWVRLLTPGLGLAALTTVVELTAGPVAFAIAVLVPSVVSLTSQLITLARSSELSGVSSSFLMINVVNQALWLVWAVLTREHAMLVACSLLGALWVINLAWFGMRQVGIVGPIRPIGATMAEPIPGMVDGLPNVVDPIPSVMDELPELAGVGTAVMDALPDSVSDKISEVVGALPDITAYQDGPPATDHG